MKTSGLSQIAAVLGVFYLQTHRFYKDLMLTLRENVTFCEKVNKC